MYEKKWLALEQAIYKMSGFPAARFQLKNRGLIQRGHYADIVIFDPQQICDNATFDQPRQEPSGIEYVMVNGQFVIFEGAIRSGCPGRLL